MKTLVVIPALNEQECVAGVIAEVYAAVPGISCLVVDDGSTDNTVKISQEAGAKVASLPFNLGVGAAMSVGFKYALSHGYDNVVQIDADGQHNPAELPGLLAQLNSYDMVIGSRFAGKDSYDIRGPRRWAMWVLGKVLSRMAHADLTDVTSGFKAMGPKTVALFAKNYPAEYLGDTVEALVIATRSGCSITQVPVAMRERQGGVASHGAIKSALYLARALMALGVALIRPRAIVNEGF